MTFAKQKTGIGAPRGSALNDQIIFSKKWHAIFNFIPKQNYFSYNLHVVIAIRHSDVYHTNMVHLPNLCS